MCSEEISAGDSLGDIETDKATMSFDASEDGYVAKFLVDGGTADIKLGTPVIILCEEEEDIAAFANYVPEAAPAAVAEPEPTPTPTPAPTQAAAPTPTAAPPVQSGDRIFASPLAKRMAADAGLALSVFAASGQNGRVTKADVEVYMEGAARTGGFRILAAALSVVS